jgi:hypothetical protein
MIGAVSNQDRRVLVDPDADGMAWLKAYLKADEAQATFDRLTHLAKNLDESELPKEERSTMDQRRADAFRDLMIDGVGPDGLGRGIRGTVAITVPVLTLLGQSDEPAILNGHGPIDPDTARKIVGTATSFTRILVQPETERGPGLDEPRRQDLRYRAGRLHRAATATTFAR